MATETRVFDGHGGVEKFERVLLVDPLDAASTKRAQLIRGGLGCRHS
jgi:hypothetical protein